MTKQTISTRLLLSIGGAFAALAIALTLISLGQFRSYYSNVQIDRAHAFASRIVQANQDLWAQYLANPGQFGQKLRSFVLYEPYTGLYLLDSQGRVLASAGEGRIFWSSLRVDLRPLRETLKSGAGTGIYGADPDVIDAGCYVTGQPIIENGQEVAWIYVVARSADRPLPEHFGNWALRAASTLLLLVLIAATLIAWVIRTLVTKPLTSLTAAAETVRANGFTQDIHQSSVPETHRKDEIGQLSRSFSAMLARLNQESARVKLNDQQRREMVQNISHDLRTPLTALLGQLETIKLKQELPDSEKQKYLSAAFQNARQLQVLTDALAEQTALDAPDSSARKEMTDLGDLVSDTAQGFEAKAQAAQIRLHCDYPEVSPMVLLDAHLMQRALNNLLDNAIRATPAGGTVQLRIVCEASAVRIEIEDSGPGIAQEDRERIFDRFVQGKVERSQRGSAGLGLAIVKRVAQLHGGTARVAQDRSIGLGGACFELRIPLTQGL